LHINRKSRDNISTRRKGSEILSKQSNQRYRKEKEREHLKKAGIESRGASDSVKNRQNQDNFNREFDAPQNSSN
jgi:hypothetical protein